MQIIGKITADIELLQKMVGSNNLITKLEVAERLALNSYYLATLVGEVYSDLNSAEFRYKSSISREIATSSLSAVKAKSLAEEKYSSLQQEVSEKDALLKKLQLLLSQTNVIIEQERQVNSYLKQELRNESRG